MSAPQAPLKAKNIVGGEKRRRNGGGVAL